MYLTINAKTKTEVKRRLAAGEKFGVEHAGGGLGGLTGTRQTDNGQFTVEGPWYPKAHTWYGTVKVVDGVVVSIK